MRVRLRVIATAAAALRLAGVRYSLYRLFRAEAAPGPIPLDVVAGRDGEVLRLTISDGEGAVCAAQIWSGATLRRCRWGVRDPGASELVLLETAPRARGRGHARALLRAVPAVLAQHGLAWARARVWWDNDASSRAFLGAGWSERPARLQLARGRWRRRWRVGRG